MSIAVSGRLFLADNDIAIETPRSTLPTGLSDEGLGLTPGTCRHRLGGHYKDGGGLKKIGWCPKTHNTECTLLPRSQQSSL